MIVPNHGLGCDASTSIGTDCDTFWYYSWPPCWTKSRQEWSNLCIGLGQSDITCGVGGCGPDYLLGIPLTGAAVVDSLKTGGWVWPAGLLIIGFLVARRYL